MKNNSIIAKRVTEKLLKPKTIWGLSSAGRASALQAEGHRFEPYRPHNLQIFGTFCSSYGGIAQLARAHGSYPWCREFKSPFRYSRSFGLSRLLLFCRRVFACQGVLSVSNLPGRTQASWKRNKSFKETQDFSRFF